MIQPAGATPEGAGSDGGVPGPVGPGVVGPGGAGARLATAGVIGLGVVGRTVCDTLAGFGHDNIRAHDIVRGPIAEPCPLAPGVMLTEQRDALDATVVVLAGPAPHAQLARWALQRRRHCVSTSDDVTDVQHLLALGGLAERQGVTLVVGAAMMPGLSGLLARKLADGLDLIDEAHCAAHGTGGPDCARQHHRALAGTSSTWHDGAWIEHPGGSGRELCWFPDPVGPRDCYRMESPEPALLVRALPQLDRASARVSATRRDRLTARLPMLRPPHADGGIGGVRVEARGAMGRARMTRVLGASGRPGVIAGVVAAVHADALVVGMIERPGVVVPGGLPALNDALLDRVAEAGVILSEFVGPSM